MKLKFETEPEHILMPLKESKFFFADTAYRSFDYIYNICMFYWREIMDEKDNITISIVDKKFIELLKNYENIYPAPTLQEFIENFNECNYSLVNKKIMSNELWAEITNDVKRKMDKKDGLETQQRASGTHNSYSNIIINAPPSLSEVTEAIDYLESDSENNRSVAF